MCFCEKCHIEFKKYLKKRYKNIDELNQRWGTIFWGQTYNEFDEIPIPTKTITVHNPTLRLEYARFRSLSLNRYADFQVEIVKKLRGDHQSITTNLPGQFFEKYFDHEQTVKNMDYVSYDNYPVWGGSEEPLPSYALAAYHDFVRGLKDKNFWIVEELIGAQGHDLIGYLPRANQAKLWSYHAFSHGCNNMLFFRWRSMNRGGEQFCYGVLDHDNKPSRKYVEMKEIIESILPYKELLDSEIKSKIAIMYDRDNVWSWMIQKQSSEFDFTNELLRLYQPFHRYNTNIDVVPISRDFNKYKVIALPVLQIVDEEIYLKAEKFVKEGGTLILSYRTGLKDRNNNIYFEKELPGYFKKMAGITVKEVEALLYGKEIKLMGEGKLRGYESKVSVWREILELNGAKTLYSYHDGLFKGKPCVTINKYEKGHVIYIGGGLEADAMEKIALDVIQSNDIDYMVCDHGLELYKRKIGSKEFLFAMNHTSHSCNYNGMVFKPLESKIISL